MSTLRVKTNEFVNRGIGLDDLYPDKYNDLNQPWFYEDESQFTQHWPSGIQIVPLSTTGTTFAQKLQNTVDNIVGRAVIQLEEEIYSLNSFVMAGSSGDPQYAFGFWHGVKLQGFLGRGADKTFIQMEADSLSLAQIERLKEYNRSDFEPIQLGLLRLDTDVANNSPVLLGGITFRSADQQMMTEFHPEVMQGTALPQPAPHNGVQLYGQTGAKGIVSYCNFEGAGTAITSAPPFETANIQSGKSEQLWHNCNFDGRRSAYFDPNRPRRCGPIMANGEEHHEIRDSWLHHSNVSRYAVNDQNREVSGTYIVSGCQADHISDNDNIDPNLNDGKPKGNVDNPCAFGYESVSATVEFDNVIIRQDNPKPTPGIGPTMPMHIMFASAGSRNPQGGRAYFTNCIGVWPAHPHLDGYLGFRIYSNTYWFIDGLNTTLFVYNKDGERLSPYVYTGVWPPTSQHLASAGVSYNTHYLVRT